MRVPILPFGTGRVALLPEEDSRVNIDRDGEVVSNDTASDFSKEKANFRVVAIDEDGEIVPDEKNDIVSKPYEQVAFEMCAISGLEWIDALRAFLSNEIRMIPGKEFLLYLNLLFWGILISNKGVSFFVDNIGMNKKKQT